MLPINLETDAFGSANGFGVSQEQQEELLSTVRIGCWSCCTRQGFVIVPSGLVTGSVGSVITGLFRALGLREIPVLVICNVFLAVLHLLLHQ